mgnify:CR=1 FL=1
MKQTVLILGSSGRFGRTAATCFETAGWDVRRFDRAKDDLLQCATGVDVIVAAWNPPYPEWNKSVQILHDQIIEVAGRTGATVIVPGNVYVFGADTPAPWGTDAPHNATNTLGQIRIEMEAAYRRSGVRTILLRAGDFIDTQASGNWIDMVMTKSLSKGVFTYPGQINIVHAWAYLPDLCRAAVALAEKRDRLPAFTDIAFPGYSLTGQDMAAVIERVVSRPVRIKQMSWLLLSLAQPVWPMARYLLEMRYLWNTPHWLDGSDFDQLLPDFNATSIETALAQAIRSTSVSNQINPNKAVAASA